MVRGPSHGRRAEARLKRTMDQSHTCLLEVSALSKPPLRLGSTRDATFISLEYEESDR